MIESKNDLAIKYIIEEEQNSYIKSSSWMVIKRDKNEIPESCFQRNKLWAQHIFERLEQDDKTPLFIVIGDGHIAGFGGEKIGEDEKISFVRHLMENLNIKTLERFAQRQGWIETLSMD